MFNNDGPLTGAPLVDLVKDPAWLGSTKPTASSRFLMRRDTALVALESISHCLRRPAIQIVVVLLLFLFAKPASADDAEFFREYIQPILQDNCYDCHSHESGEASGGLVLDSKAGWSVGGDSGPAIVPLSLEKSLLWRVVNYEEDGLEMPPEGKLSDGDLVLIRKWIESGAVDPREDGRAAEKTKIDIEEGRQWWAFQPLRSESILEQNENANSAAARIDHFIDQRLITAQLTPAPRADRQTLLRRVSYDLVGLPPNQDFVASDQHLDEQAYADYVDQLLASEGFGEKWGRHWLDVVRYADSNGSSFNVPFHNAWRYRNWVIEAINRNMPVDHFIQKQIAGDLMPAASVTERDENLIATGFLMLGSKVLGTFDKEQLILDVIDEQVDTIGKAMLGMTLGCARCHDHKFDPLPQSDYYALAGILASTSTLVDRIGGPIDDESDWERRGLGFEGDERLVEFLKGNRYAWVKAVRKHFQARKTLDALRDQVATTGAHSQSQDQTREQLATEIEEAENALEVAEKELRELVAQMPPHAMAVREADDIVDLEIRIRGVASSKGQRVPRGFLQVAAYDRQPTVPPDQSGRLQLAQWMTSPDNPLTARVFVNRVWKHLFREGLVRSVDNFGTTGDMPSHPELLDDLTARFIENGWSLKWLVREIVLSEVYCREVTSSDLRDPENRLLAHQNRRRLEAEEIRDTLLLLRGCLDRGPNTDILHTLPIGDVSNLGDYLDIQDNRRTVYQPVIRTVEPQILQLFDAASNTMVTGARPRTIVAPQSLYFLNSSFVQDAAGQIGERILNRYTGDQSSSLDAVVYSKILDDLVDDLMRTLVCRNPTPEEQSLLQQYIKAQADGESGLTRHDMLKVCQAIISSTQFQFLD